MLPPCSFPGPPRFGSDGPWEWSRSGPPRKGGQWNRGNRRGAAGIHRRTLVRGVRSGRRSQRHEEPGRQAVNAPAISARRMLAEELARPDAELNLGRAALLVAKEEYP